jgi:6-phosphogluconolactonase
MFLAIRMKPEIKIFQNPEELAIAVANDWREGAQQAVRSGNKFSIVLCGGSTPAMLYRCLSSEEFWRSIPWNSVHLFWGDERCVPPEDMESNFRMVQELLIDHISIPAQNINRIKGEADPVTEAIQYGKKIQDHFGLGVKGVPCFDWVILGLGVDGHTASIFPHVNSSYRDLGLCAVTVHPESGQKRITMTPKIFNNALRVTFLVTGKKKASIVRDIMGEGSNVENYPAKQVNPVRGTLQWWLDPEAARLLKS